MISLSVPARAEYVHVLRTVVSGVGAGQDLSIDDIDDLRLAVDEASAHLLKIDPDAQALRLDLETQGTSLIVTVGIATPARRNEAPTDQFLTWHILGALTDGAESVVEEYGPAVRFSKRMKPPTRL